MAGSCSTPIKIALGDWKTNHVPSLLQPTTRDNPRVFVGLWEVAGFYTRIVSDLRTRGVPVSLSLLRPHKLGYEANSTLSDYPFQEALQSPVSVRRPLTILRAIATYLHHFLWAVKNFDIFVFTYGTTFIPKQLDLRLLKMLRKKVVVFVSHGSEARPPYMDGAWWDMALKKEDPIRFIRIQTQRQFQKLRRLEKLSHEIVAHPLTSQFLTRPAICSGYIGNPPPAPHASLNDGRSDSTFLILHAPSNRRVKGSDEIKRVIDRLSIKFPRIMYRELFNVPNSEVIQLLARADLVIDQLYIDTYLAGFGTEAASLGVPALSGSYAIRELRLMIDPSSQPPTLLVHPSLLESTLVRLLADQSSITELGRECHRFINEKGSISQVASRWLSVVLGDYPKTWTFKPTDFAYVYGIGLNEVELVTIAREGMRRFGESFFCLGERSDILKTMKELTLR